MIIHATFYYKKFENVLSIVLKRKCVRNRIEIKIFETKIV